MSWSVPTPVTSGGPGRRGGESQAFVYSQGGVRDPESAAVALSRSQPVAWIAVQVGSADAAVPIAIVKHAARFDPAAA